MQNVKYLARSIAVYVSVAVRPDRYSVGIAKYSYLTSSGVQHSLAPHMAKFATCGDHQYLTVVHRISTALACTLKGPAQHAVNDVNAFRHTSNPNDRQQTVHRHPVHTRNGN